MSRRGLKEHFSCGGTTVHKGSCRVVVAEVGES